MDKLKEYRCTIDKKRENLIKDQLKKKKKKKGSSKSENATNGGLGGGVGWFETPDQRWKEGTWINCDLRYFNLGTLGGNFGIIYLDPPWRDLKHKRKYKKKNKNGTKLVHENSNGAPDLVDELLENFERKNKNYYKTLKNEEIYNIDISSISDHGFLFMWVPTHLLEFGLSCFSHWGYLYVDRVRCYFLSVPPSFPLFLSFPFLPFIDYFSLLPSPTSFLSFPLLSFPFS